jgi:predicted O-methyltransferase YrrM
MGNATLTPKKDDYARWSLNVKPHWSRRYLWNRYKEYLYRRKNPDHPWLTQEAINIISSLLLPTDHILEFGSGRSTIWFANRVEKVISVENQADWFKVVEEQLKTINRKVDFVLIEDGEHQLAKYREKIGAIPNESIDICLVDGGPRALAAVESLPKVKRGGFMIIDNANWFIPSESKTPNSIRTTEQSDPLFQSFSASVKGWRVIWTSNGVTDTAIYIKP